MKTSEANLHIVMPVFNESESIVRVIEEWTQAIERLNVPYVFGVFNDGSTDGTEQKLFELLPGYVFRGGKYRLFSKWIQLLNLYAM